MAGVETRNAARSSLFMVTTIMLENNARTYQVKVRNLSAKGMMAEGEVPVATGSRLTVQPESGNPVTGVVAWIEGGRFGIAFDNDVDMAAFRRTAKPVAHTIPAHLEISQRNLPRQAVGRIRKV